MCYKRGMHGMHNLHFRLSLHLIWDMVLEGFLIWFGVFCKRVLAPAVLLAGIPFFCSKPWPLPAHIHTFISQEYFFFSRFKLPPPVSGSDFNLFQSPYSLWLCILFNCLNKTRIKRNSTAVYFLYSRSSCQTMSGLWHLIALIKS